MKFRDLIVWQKSMDLVDKVYAYADFFPREERLGLWSQITRSAVSIPSNIAEGSGRSTRKDCLHFFSVARGSLYELSTQLEICQRRGYGTMDADLTDLCNEVAKMLTKMICQPPQVCGLPRSVAGKASTTADIPAPAPAPATATAAAPTTNYQLPTTNYQLFFN